MRLIQKLGVLIVLALGATLSFSGPAGANQILNPGFDADSPAKGVAPLDWTLTPASSGSFFQVGGGPAPVSPPNSANFGATGAFDDILSQEIKTSPGGSYTFSFELKLHDSPAPDDDFSASFGGTTLLSLTNSADFTYTPFSYKVTATSALTTVSFAGRAEHDFYSLDDVSVTPLVAVPEPSSLSLLGAGLLQMAGLIWWFRRKRQTTAP